MIALVVMTDGRREYIARTIPSALEQLRGPITRRIIHDDSGDPTYRAWLRSEFPSFEIVETPGRSGFSGAYASAWSFLAEHVLEPWIFSTEDDFTFNRPVDLAAMARVLEANPHVVQLALRRQAWNETERFAGGVVEASPDAYVDVEDGDDRWLEHRLFFTTNPALYRRALVDGGWPDGKHSEGLFTHRVLRDPVARFGYWGPRTDPPWVEHIGVERKGTAY